MFNPISLTVPAYVYYRTRSFSRIYDEEFGDAKFDNPNFVSFRRHPKASVLSHCIPISETYRFFQNKDNIRIRKDMLTISFLSVFYDSIFDEDYNPDSITFAGKLLNGEKIKPETDLDKLVALAFGKLEDSISRDKMGLYACLNRIHELQIAGLNQRREQYLEIPTSSQEEYLRYITFSKGAYAFLTYSYVANPDIDDEDLVKDIKEIGAYLQIFDDMLDVYKDANDSNVTLITEGFISEDDIEEKAQNALSLLDKRFYPSTTKPIVLESLKIMHKEGLNKLRRFKQGLLDSNLRLHKIAFLFR